MKKQHETPVIDILRVNGNVISTSGESSVDNGDGVPTGGTPENGN